MLDRFQLIDKRERIRPMNMKIQRTRRLLMLFAAAVLAAGFLALVNANPAWTADRSFAPAPNSPVPVGSTPTTVTNADFNGDGKMDLAAQNSGSNNVSVRLGNGDGTFQAKQDFGVGLTPTSVISADFDSDGIADLAVTNQDSNNVSVLLGQDLDSDGKGDGTFKQKQDFAVGFRPSSAVSADFNGDTYADLAVANSTSNTVSVLLGQDSNGDNKADGTFRAKQDFSIATRTCNDFLCAWNTAAPNQVISADFNGDNKADLATANFGSSTFNDTGPGGVSVLLGKGDGTFQTYKLVKTNAANSKVPSIAAVDFNASGPLDLVATEYNSNVVSLLRGIGDGTFQTEQYLPVGSNPSAVTSADLDGDTKADDLAVSNYGSNDVSVLFNNDSGGFQAARSFPAGNAPAFVIGADFDADSFADLAVANQNSNNVSVLLNTEVDTTAPVISNVSPADKSQNVPLATNVEATFSEDMDASDTDGDPSTLTASTFTLIKQGSSTPVGAQVSYDSASKKATLDPTSDLEANTPYTATIKGGSTGAEDLAGNALAQDYTWTFTTAAPAAPTAMAPKHSFTTLSTLGTSTVPVKLTWSATDNPGGSGIASYQLQQSINGGAYTDVSLPSATATTISASLAPGTNTYRYRVAAKDNAGNLSAWATGPSFKVSAFQESSSAIVDTGSWTTSALSGAYGGSVQYASALGRNATFTVPAGSKNVEWVSYRGNRGKAQVWLDGVQQDANPNVTGIQPFDLYSSIAQARKVVFSKAVSATTSHKLEVRVLGKKNASSTSTRVDIDAFVTTS
jgi:hypothetical protein